MSDTNRVTLIGRLTRDAELRYTNTGTAIMNLSLAVNEKYTAGGEKKEFVSFFEVTVWGKIGEVLNQYLKKGKQIAVDGKLRQERWNDKEGQSRSKIKVIAENIQLLGGMKQDSGGAPIVPDSVSDSTHDEDDIPF